MPYELKNFVFARGPSDITLLTIVDIEHYYFQSVIELKNKTSVYFRGQNTMCFPTVNHKKTSHGLKI